MINMGADQCVLGLHFEARWYKKPDELSLGDHGRTKHRNSRDNKHPNQSRYIYNQP